MLTIRYKSFHVTLIISIWLFLRTVPDTIYWRMPLLWAVVFCTCRSTNYFTFIPYKNNSKDEKTTKLLTERDSPTFRSLRIKQTLRGMQDTYRDVRIIAQQARARSKGQVRAAHRTCGSKVKPIRYLSRESYVCCYRPGPPGMLLLFPRL